jgi:hypothetical protein
MGYGFCGTCRDFHPAEADFNLANYTPARRVGGGFMRCMSASLDAWAVYHPAPWEPGLLVRCVYHPDSVLDTMRFCRCGFWHWSPDVCEPEKEPVMPT